MKKICVLNSHPIQYFSPLYRRLNEQSDIDVTVLYCSRQGLDAYADEGFGNVEVKWDIPLLEGFDSAFLDNVSPRPQVGPFAGLINPSVIHELRRRAPDALWVHGHNYATNLIGITAAKLLGIPVMMRGETHLLLQRPTLKKAMRRPLMTALYGMLDAFLAIGSRNREFYIAHGVDPERIFMVPYVVDNAHFQRLSLPAEKRDAFLRDNGLDPSVPIVLFASKFIERKRPRDLLEAHHALKKRGVACQLVYVGDGPLRGELEAYIARHDVPDVHMMGFRNQSELPAWYSAANVFVLPSENEPWGLILNEVMSVGLPVITPGEVGAAADLVLDGKTGFTYAAGDIDTLADRIERTVADMELQLAMGHAARERMRTWSFDQAVDGIREALFAVS